MIYNILNAFSESTKGFRQFWSLEGLILMTSATIQSSNLFEDFANSFSPKPSAKVNDSFETQTASISDEATVYYRDRQVTFSEIFTYALPDSSEALSFDDLARQVWIVKEGTSLVDRDDSKVIQTFLIMSDIIDIHWDKFSLKTKVLLLNKLQLFNKNIWQITLWFISKFYSTLQEKSERNKKYFAEYNSLNPADRNKIVQKSFTNSRLFIKSIVKTSSIASKIFKKDGYLLKENKENIIDFNQSVKTMIVAREGMKKYRQTLIELAK